MPRARHLDLDDDDGFDDEEPHRILRHGESIKVPMKWADEQLRSELYSRSAVTDAYGTAAGHRPGYLFDAGRGAQHLRDQIEQQREARMRQTRDAWRDGSMPTSSTFDAERLADARRTLATSDDVAELRRARQQIAGAAWHQPSQIVAERPEAIGGPSGPSGTRDVATRILGASTTRAEADAAWEARRQQTLNAWRLP